MNRVVDVKGTRREAGDREGVRALLSLLVGQPFRFFRISYGDEVRLHLGDLRRPSRGRGRPAGSYVLGVRASFWALVSLPASAILRDDARELERLDAVTPGAVVVAATADVTPDGFSLRLEFSDSSTFFVSPRADESSDDDAPLADWELLSPHSRLLSVGPGARWPHLDA